MQSEKKYGVVVVTYNRLELLKGCLKKIYEQTVPFAEIVVIDNNSTDGSKEYLSEIRCDNIHIVLLDDNVGASGGFSRGIEEIKKLDIDYVLIIDDDAHIDSNYVEAIENIRLKTEYEALSGTVYENGEIAKKHRRRVRNFYSLKPYMVPDADYQQEMFEYDLTSFCGIVISKPLIEEIGLPRRDYFTQYTDTEYSLRIRRKAKIVNVNAAHLQHKVKKVDKNTREGKGNYSYKSYYTFRNKIYTYTRYSKVGWAWAISFLMFYGIRMIKETLFILVRRNNKMQAKYDLKVTFHSLKDGLKGNLGKNTLFLPEY